MTGFYQDKWVRGVVQAKGYRECAQRYKAIREFCQEYYCRLFTVCDIGANWSYFGLRLTEDFPGCSVMAFEYTNFSARMGHLRKNESDRILLLNKKLSVPEIRLLGAFVKFDVVLALSVLHHLPGTLEERLSAVRMLGHNVLVELAGADSPRGDQFDAEALGEVIGTGRSHRDGSERPIIRLR